LSASVARIEEKVTAAVPYNESLSSGAYLTSCAERLPGGVWHESSQREPQDRRRGRAGRRHLPGIL